MKLKVMATFKLLVHKNINNRNVSRKKLLLSYVSLFLTFTVLILATFSWFTIQDTATINSQTFTLESASGLRVNEGESISNHITLQDIKLDEASSVDGRNIYFPTTGTFEETLSNMFFREGTAGDKNVRYVYKDFTISGDSDLTYVYIKSYEVKVGDTTYTGTTEIEYDSSGKPVNQVETQECPVRIAFITDSSETPIVIDPHALVENYVTNYDAVNSTNEDGIATTKTTDYSPFSSYFFGPDCSPAFTLVGNTQVDVTMVVWLEGTGENCDEYADEEISIDIELESNWEDMELVTFIDDTIGDNGETSGDAAHWISGGSSILAMSYKDPDSGNYKTIVMSQIDTYKWAAYLPKSVETDILFYRYDSSKEIIYNAWRTESGVNSQLNSTSEGWRDTSFNSGKLQESRVYNGVRQTVYTAIRGNGWGKVTEGQDDTTEKRLSPCIGYWGYTGDSGAGDGGDDSGGDTSDECVGNLYLNIPDSLSWLRDDLGDGNSNYDMYAIFYYNGSTYQEKMSYSSGRCSLNYSVAYGTALRGFIAINKYDNTNKGTISLKSTLTFTKADYNYTFALSSSNWQEASLQ